MGIKNIKWSNSSGEGKAHNYGPEIKWRTIIGLLLVYGAIILNWQWIWGIFFLYWITLDIMSRETYFIEPIDRKNHPFLYWLILITWVALSVVMFFPNASVLSSIESGGSNLPDAVRVVTQPAAPAHQLRQEGTIQLVGIVKETGIQNGQYAQDLEQLWLQYAESETLFSLENTVDNKTYVAYLNYSENRDRFTIIIGHRVANFEAVPVGLSQIIIPATTYAQFNITGNLDEAIPKTWEAIERSNLKRAYSTDLEVYDYQQENVAEIWASVN